MGIGEVFEQFCKNLVISNGESISYRYKRITRQLNSDFYGYADDTMHSIYAGSYGRDTAIAGFSDLDMLFWLHPDDYSRFDNQIGKGRERFLPFADNLKHTVNLYIKYSTAICTVSFSNDGFVALRDTFAVRDRITHPKTYEKISISTDETRRAGEAIQWVHDLILGVIGGHNAKLESNIKQKMQTSVSPHY